MTDQNDLDRLSNIDIKNVGPLTDEELKKRTGAHIIKRGEEIHLSQLDHALKKALIGGGWDVPGVDPAGIDIDFSLFLVDKNDQTREDGDFVFYNNPAGAGGTATHTGDNRSGAGDGDDERIFVNLEELPYDIAKIILVVSVYEADLRDQHIGLLRNGYLRLVNQETDREILRYNLEGFSGNRLHYAAVVAEIVREGPVWLFRALLDEVEGGLSKIATRHGIMVTG